jgi:NAD(P)-dependent dehydrogenase (short-subunit alcohol dehydrogenase family)
LGASQVHLGQLRTAIGEDLQSAALFLASDDSSYVNGMELVVDGGTTVI